MNSEAWQGRGLRRGGRRLREHDPLPPPLRLGAESVLPNFQAPRADRQKKLGFRQVAIAGDSVKLRGGCKSGQGIPGTAIGLVQCPSVPSTLLNKIRETLDAPSISDPKEETASQTRSSTETANREGHDSRFC